ncbi:protein-glutamine gamma-glutamyltransferase [Metabacillus arenae]|uniref:Protein-glutamine gamma-glutamyltransferase n=1 Tax=Metabacillus arenae TaxID=2771434 RepID=A0A926NL13_9BACI|nr:protein-glutamine gamma-glutamyltransferase [Metabacillus arenae]MBD1382558.1 protein-glutamine gamma-glutamyltransferase [Metabacillus arenae]
MIKIRNYTLNMNFLQQAAFNNEQQEILDFMVKYPKVYSYDSFEQLEFELAVREDVVESARALLKSGATFETFATSYCNPLFWTLNSQGAFIIKRGIRPSDAIEDIYQNGRLYGFECATAIVICFYRAVLKNIDRFQFDRIFYGMILYDWHFDDDLGIFTTRGNDFLPGDCLYFNNPDFDPETPHWRGENTIYLGEDLHFAHGIGIKDGEGIIEALNKYRRPSASQSAYLLPQVTRLDFNYLFNYRSLSQNTRPKKKISNRYAAGQIGDHLYLS